MQRCANTHAIMVLLNISALNGRTTPQHTTGGYTTHRRRSVVTHSQRATWGHHVTEVSQDDARGIGFASVARATSLIFRLSRFSAALQEAAWLPIVLQTLLGEISEKIHWCSSCGRS